MMSRGTKELRPLLVPAGLILAATFLAAWWGTFGRPLASWSRSLAIMSFYLGSSLLCATSLGAEFQHRTVGLLLAQPLSRTRLWFEKWAVLAFVVSMVAAIQLASLDTARFALARPFGNPVLFVAAMACSSGLWTLLARSTIGGAAFSIAISVFLELVASFVSAWVSGAPRVMFADTRVLNGLRVLYCATSLALGCWLFTRLQITGSGYERRGDSLGYRSAWPGFLQPGRTGALRNLFLKELRLHRPTFIVAGLFAALWLIAVLSFSVGAAHEAVANVTFLLLTFLYLPLGIVLAGGISPGEEAALGVHAWHLTLPVRARTHWAVKAVTAILVAVFAVIVLPLALREVTRMTLGAPATSTLVAFGPFEIAAVIAAVILCFWSATLFGHTVRGAVAAGALLVTLGVAGTATSLLADRWDPGMTLLTRAMVAWQLPPDFFTLGRRGQLMEGLVSGGFIGGFIVLALHQSFRAFSQQITGRAAIVRQFATVFVTLLVAATIVISYLNSAVRLPWTSTPARELREALEIVAYQRQPAASVALSPDELQTIAQLSAPTRAWIRDSKIRLEKVPRLPKARRASRSLYQVIVEFPNGRRYVIRYFEPLAK